MSDLRITPTYVQSVPNGAERVFGQLLVPIAGTPVALSTHAVFAAPANRVFTNIIVQGLHSNTGNVFVGYLATVSATNAAQVLAAFGSWVVPWNFVDDIFLDVSVGGEGIFFSCTR